MLSRDELLLYSRQIILPEIDIEGQERLKNSQALIIGLGGLGSPAAMYLTAAGVGNITLADHDLVERSNLQRQIAHSMGALDLPKVVSAKHTLHSLNPNIEIRTIEAEADKALLDELISQTNYDVILDCTDNFESRFSINNHSAQSGVPLVSATAVGFSGQVGVFNQDSDAACYNCLYSATELPEGDCSEQGILSPVVGTMGTLQATEALKIILNLNKETRDSYLLKYDSLPMSFKTFKVAKDKSCKSCN